MNIVFFKHNLMLAGFVLLGQTITAQATVEFDQDVTPEVIYGSGNANGSFTTDRNNGIEVGLRAKIPFVGTTNSNGDGTYSFTLLETDHDNNPGTDNRWNFDFTVNTDFDNSTSDNLDQYFYELGLDTDPSLGVDYTISDPINAVAAALYGHSVGDNSTGNGQGTEPGIFAYAGALGTNNVLQNSWAYEFSSTGVDPADYDPDIPGTYAVYFQVSDGNGIVARTDIQVLIGGAPAAVAPNAPAIPDLITDSGSVDSDDVTNVNTPTFDVQCTVDTHEVNLYSDQPVADSNIATHQCSTVGIEQVTANVVLADTTHNITYTETNVVGESPQSPSLAVLIDTAEPLDPVIDGIGNTFTTITGTAESNSSITITGTTCTNAPISADINGDWSCDLVAPLNEMVVVSATATDLAGNVSAQIDAVVQDVNDAPSFSVTCELDATDVTGLSNSVVFIPAYAFGFSVGPANEASQDYIMSIAAQLGGDPDGLILSASINPTGDLTLDIDTTKNSVATMELTMQDDGGVALGGIDTTVIAFNVHHYADLSMDPNFMSLDPNDILYKNTFDACRQ